MGKCLANSQICKPDRVFVTALLSMWISVRICISAAPSHWLTAKYLVWYKSYARTYQILHLFIVQCAQCIKRLNQIIWWVIEQFDILQNIEQRRFIFTGQYFCFVEASMAVLKLPNRLIILIRSHFWRSLIAFKTYLWPRTFFAPHFWTSVSPRGLAKNLILHMTYDGYVRFLRRKMLWNSWLFSCKLSTVCWTESRRISSE